MPLKDKKKQLEYNKQWKAKNKEKVKKYQSFHQSTYRDKKYQPIITKLQNFSYEDQKKYLLSLYGPKRQAILRRINNSKLEQDIQNILKQKRRQVTKKRMDKNWNFVKKWITDRSCDCGENNITKLSFHHLDPSKKTAVISQICKYSMKKVLQELKKGVVKCKNCHTIIHAGTSEEREKILINQFFNQNTHRKGRYKNKLLIWELKKSLSCIKCGIDDPVILLFHHIDSKLKKEKICLLFKTSRGIINQEIAKTTCLCHNCHKDFHCIYGRKTNTQQLEGYLNKKVFPIKINIEDYLPIINQKISSQPCPL